MQAWVTDQLLEKIGDKGNLNERLGLKADEAAVAQLRRKIAEINSTIQKGFDAIIVSAKNEVKLAIGN